MKNISLYEEKKYTLIQLKEILGSDIIKQLINSNVLVNVKNREGIKIYRNKFVGIIVVKNICIISYPKYIPIENATHKEISQIINVLHKHNKRKYDFGYDFSTDIEEDGMIFTALNLLEDYFESGLYKVDKETVITNGDGAVLWEMTINNHTPIIIRDRPFYLELETLQISYNNFNFFEELHKSIIMDIFNRFRIILDIIKIPEIYFDVFSLSEFDKDNLILTELEREQSSQFVSSKQVKLNLMKNYIIEKENTNKYNNMYILGTDSFNVVWEDVCAVYFRNKLGHTLKQLGLVYNTEIDLNKTLKEIIDKPKWKYSINENQFEIYKDTLIPDIISINNNSFDIYDAKYYNLKISEESIKGQPGIEDITKQYIYQQAYQNLIIQNKFDLVKNKFLFPSNNKKTISIGNISIEFFSNLGLENIEIILLSAESAYKRYLEL